MGESQEVTETPEAGKRRIKAAIHAGLNEVECHLSDDEYDDAFRRIYRAIRQGRHQLKFMLGGKVVTFKLPSGKSHADR